MTRAAALLTLLALTVSACAQATRPAPPTAAEPAPTRVEVMAEAPATSAPARPAPVLSVGPAEPAESAADESQHLA